ncbi:MAG: isochorismatase family protein [Acidobacteriaceae bacterium]
MPKPRRALIVIDVQNDYIEGALPIEYPDVRHSLSHIGRAMDAARAAAIPVIVVQHTSPPDSPVFARNTPGWALHETVRTRPCDYSIEKSSPSAFVGTDLGRWLRQRRIDTLTVVGYMTHNCDDSTLKQAMQEGFAVEFLADAAGALSYENRAGRASAEELHRVFCVVLQSRFAAVASTDEWIAALPAGAALARDTIYASAERARGRVPVETPAASPPSPRLRRLTAEDAARIARWPAYPREFEDLDYALRPNGWLDEFRDQPGALSFVAEESGEPVGFTILARTGDAEAEFRMALRADRVGSGLGRKLASETLSVGFGELGLSRIHLVVRQNNPRAIRLYERLGFLKRGECRKTFNGTPAQFLVMDLQKDH